MNLIITTQEDLEAIVKTSVEQSVSKFYLTKAEEEKKEDFITVKDAARYLNVSELTVRNYIKRGTLSAKRIGNRIVINRKKLEESLKEVKSLKYRR
jgi:excisionase family DNA binding protein